MRYVVQIRSGNEWIDYEDRFKEKREYSDPAVGHNWIQGASSLPESPQYRLYDRESPSSLKEAIVDLFRTYGPMADAEVYERLQSRKEAWGNFCDRSEQRVRTERSNLVKKGVVRKSEKRVPTARGKKAAVWELTDDEEE